MPNRLADESSPYLRQHAHNPVDWYPWGKEAFEQARSHDLPVLLSIGYSACHWCHVMAHESFEDPATAAVMNELFVNIKVDREERPDVDDIYMQAVLAMTGAGGWPMTVFLTPDGRPFFGGTYFPRTPTHGRPGFVELLRAVADSWRDRRSEVLLQADHLTEAIRARTTVPGAGSDADPGASPLAAAHDALAAAFDHDWGGFGRAPKFPMTCNLELLLRVHAHTGSTDTLAMVTRTLDAMASGGIYDHLGGGFSRYSVDRKWLVPHFEKMLYDNALIPRAYLHAWQVTGNASYRQVVEETIGYVLRDLGAPEGGVYSAEDADSEGVEGKFYVWTPEQFEAVLGARRAAAACSFYGVTDEGNFEGASILNRGGRADLLRPPEIETARRMLAEARAQRVRPGLDDKVVTEWNAMFVATLAEAGVALGRSEWLDAAERCAEFLLQTLRRQGRWLRAWQRDAGARHLAYASDYAHLIDAFTRLSEATGRRRWLAEARLVADDLLTLFSDDAEGGLYTTGTDAEQLLVRAKDTYDGATPSANSVAAVALLRLGALTGTEAYTRAAQAILHMLRGYLAEQPTAVTVALAAADLITSGITEIVVSGRRDDLVNVVHQRYLPNAVLAWGEPFSSPLWEGRSEPAAYVCRGYTCGLPARTPQELAAQLDP